MRIVIALGGNALLHRGERPDAAVQEANIDRVTTAIAALAQEHEIVITHGNGPQIGLLAVESAADPALSAPYPLDLLRRPDPGHDRLPAALHPARRPARTADRRAGHSHPCRRRRPGLRPPHQVRRPGVPPRGRLHARPNARLAHRRRHHRLAPRRPLPAPERILETDTVHELLNSGTLVICAGGGGVPVTADQDTGALTGSEAVIDKDLTAALLAEDLKADFLLILTDVPCVYAAGYGTPDQRPVLGASPAELRRGGFPDGSMGPKTEAAARFVEHTGDWPRSDPWTPRRRDRPRQVGHPRQAGPDRCVNARDQGAERPSPKAGQPATAPPGPPGGHHVARVSKGRHSSAEQGREPAMTATVTAGTRAPEALRGFAGTRWRERVDVRDFIQANYTPYEGDGAFLTGPTDRTRTVWTRSAPSSRRNGAGASSMSTRPPPRRSPRTRPGRHRPRAS